MLNKQMMQQPTRLKWHPPAKLLIYFLTRSIPKWCFVCPSRRRRATSGSLLATRGLQSFGFIHVYVARPLSPKVWNEWLGTKCRKGAGAETVSAAVDIAGASVTGVNCWNADATMRRLPSESGKLNQQSNFSAVPIQIDVWCQAWYPKTQGGLQ